MDIFMLAMDHIIMCVTWKGSLINPERIIKRLQPNFNVLFHTHCFVLFAEATGTFFQQRILDKPTVPCPHSTKKQTDEISN